MSKFFENYKKNNNITYTTSNYVNPRYASNQLDNEAYKNKLHEVKKHDCRFDGTGRKFGSHKRLFVSHHNYKSFA